MLFGQWYKEDCIMSIINSIKIKLGLSNTTTNNFTLTAEAADGSMKLARGNPGATTQDIITVDAAGLVMHTQGSAGNIKLVAAQNATGTAVDFTGIPSWAKRITVIFNGISTNGTSQYQIQLGAGAIETTGYSGGSEQAGARQTNSSGFTLIRTITTADLVSGQETLLNLGTTIWIASGIATPSTTATGAFNSGAKTLSGVLDRIRLTTVNGTDTFDAGQISIMYEG